MSNLRTLATKLAQRPYSLIIIRDKTTDGDYMYLARNPELEGCMAQGETPKEAEDYLAEFRVDYIEFLLERGQPIPEPEIHTFGRSINSESTENRSIRKDIMPDPKPINAKVTPTSIS